MLSKDIELFFCDDRYKGETDCARRRYTTFFKTYNIHTYEKQKPGLFIMGVNYVNHFKGCVRFNTVMQVTFVKYK